MIAQSPSEPPIGKRASVYIILVNWNGCADTIECLESLVRLEDDDFSVVIVDNGSSDQSAERIRDWSIAPAATMPRSPIWSRLPKARRIAADVRVVALADDPAPIPDGSRITMIMAGANLGFAAANNIGMAFADRDPDTAYFWILNNDTVVEPASLSMLRTYARSDPQRGLIGAVAFYYHDPDVVQGVAGWFNPARAEGGHIGHMCSRDTLPSTETIRSKIAYVMGVSMFVARPVYDYVGGMCEDYFLYYEELDWAARIAGRFGQDVCREARLYHKEGAAIGTSTVRRSSDTALYYMAVNLLRFMKKHHSRYLAAAYRRLVRLLVRYVQRRSLGAFRATMLAIIDVALGRWRNGKYGSPEFKAYRSAPPGVRE